MIVPNTPTLQEQLSGFPRLQSKNSFVIDEKDYHRHFTEARRQHPVESEIQCRERAVIRCLTLDQVQTEDTVLAPLPEFRQFVAKQFKTALIVNSAGLGLLLLLELYQLLK
jgi:hypothetical protein